MKKLSDKKKWKYIEMAIEAKKKYDVSTRFPVKFLVPRHMLTFFVGNLNICFIQRQSSCICFTASLVGSEI